MASTLPWGKAVSSSAGAGVGLPGASVDVSVAPWPSRGFFSRSPAFSRHEGGSWLAAPGTPYQIEVTLREQRPPRAGALRVVCCSIDEREVSEQIIVHSPDSAGGRFTGWLEDATGAKRLKFVFPATAGQTATIKVGVFEGTLDGTAAKASIMPPAPGTDVGASFAGPLVGTAVYKLGDIVAIGAVQLQAERVRV
jgi:hypothetical protein